MHNRILIVAETEGFLIKGLETKLKGIGLESRYSVPKMRDLEDKCTDTDLIFIFTDENVGLYPESLVYIKDRCVENDEQVVVIGAEAEYEVIRSFIPDAYMFKFFKRPLDMEALINDIEEYMEESAQHARKKSILIVDDDVSYMGMIMDWLKDKYRVSLANSGMQAITWLAKNHADLILLDYEMPITSGPQVLEMIRSDPSTADIPVMFLTGKGDKESIMRVLSLKPVGYQLKTIERKQLRENIANFFTTQDTKK
ncbi:MAG: response regulator [Lachnospiraceae bacterium]|nr:response regulator [Lachnospiraceae bacterium]